jgi:signal transduction histidine kinase
VSGIGYDAHDRKRSFPGVTLNVLMAIVPGMLLGISTVGFIYLLVFGYQVFTPEDAERQRAARELATGWTPALFFTLGACALAFMVGCRVRTRGVSLGLLVGLSAAVAEQTLVFLKYPPVVPNELLLYVLLGVCGGAVGGWFSVLEVARSETSERALFDETVNIARSENPDQVAEAIGALVGRERIAGVGVWRTSPFDRNSVAEPAGVWEAGGPGTFRAARLLAVAVWRDHGRARSVLADSLSAEARRVWAEAGVRSAFLGPLIYMGGESLGFLFVGFRRMTIFARASRRRVLSAAAAAGLALEKAERNRRIGVMEERERASRELHDGLIQCLAGIVLELNSAQRAKEVGASGIVWDHIERAREAARLATGEARRLVHAMRPEVLDGSSLPEALAVTAHRVFQETDIEATCEVVGEVRPLSPEAEHALVRITQEALSNVRKHSDASHAIVSLGYEPSRVVLEVADDGSGGAEVDHDVGFGMRSMRERAERLGGRLLVESSGGKGTKVIVDVTT